MGLLDQLGQAAGGLLGGEGGDTNPLLQAVMGLLDKIVLPEGWMALFRL